MAAPRPAPLDTVTAREVVDRVLAAGRSAADAATAAAAGLAEVADLLAGRLAAGGRLLLTAPPGALTDLVDDAVERLAAEHGFGSVVRAFPAGATPGPTARDGVLLLTADGGHDLADGARTARSAGSALALLTTVAAPEPAGSAELVVTLDPGPDVVHGSGLAATAALRGALDAVTTAVAAQLGRVHDDLPVDLEATDEPSRERVVAMVAAISGAAPDAARAAAIACGHDVRVAVLALAADLPPAEAAMLAARHRTLRDALADPPPRLPR